jgi:hypothetical protein
MPFFIPLRALPVTLACLTAGCAVSNSPSGVGGMEASGGAGGRGGSASGGRSGSGGTGTGGVGSSGATPAPGGTGGAGQDASPAPADAPITPPSDDGGGPPTEGDAGITADTAPPIDSRTPMTVPGQPPPSYEGQIPIYDGPEVGPQVMMDCPEDPTVGWKEYKESFRVEHPYTIPTNTRFSITGGIYNFWVFPNDAPHSPTAQGRNPRTEASYGGLYDKTPGSPGSDGRGHFISGQRLYSADMRIEKNAIGSAIMQIHTTATGGGPIGIRMQANSDIVNNGSLTVVKGSDFPGGLVDKWFNYKASLNADTLEVKIYINNCLKSTYKGDKGDGHFYFKNGVYFCKTSQNGCFSHYKNIHLYTK